MNSRIAGLGFGLGLVVLAAAMAGGCGLLSDTCTLAGCEDGVWISLQPPLTVEGDYWVVIDIDDESLECPVVPDRSCPGISVGMPRRSREIHVGETTRTEWEDLPGVVSIRLERRTPERFTLRIFRDETEVLRQSVKPAYHKNQPNGAECDGDYYCTGASETIRTD